MFFLEFMPDSKIVFSATLAAGLVLLPGLASANCTGNSCRNVKIDRIYVRNTDDIYINTTGDETQLNCRPIQGKYIALRPSHRQFDQVYSLLLSTKLADKDIWIRVVNAPTADCALSYVVME